MSADPHPPALQPGDRIAVVAPSSAVDAERVTAGCEVLRDWGYVPELSANLHAQRGHLAGEDHLRADDLNAAFRDPGIRAVWAARGGAGATRVLDRLDWAALGRDPKLIVGFSDITALHAGTGVRAGLTSIHGQFVGRLHVQEPTTLAWLQALVSGEVPAGTAVPYGPGDDVVTVAGGTGEGRLVGGNLATLVSLIGTPDEPNTDGCVLLLEEVGEAPHRIDRWLIQLLRSTLLDGVTGVVVGAFTDCEPLPGQSSLTADEVVADVLGDLGVPVVAGWSLGHSDQQVALPLGTGVRIDADARTLTILEGVVAQRL